MKKLSSLILAALFLFLSVGSAQAPESIPSAITLKSGTLPSQMPRHASEEIPLLQPQEAELFAQQETTPQPFVGALVVFLAFADTATDNLYASYGMQLENYLEAMAQYYDEMSYGKTEFYYQIPQLAEGELTVIPYSQNRSYFEAYHPYLNPNGIARNEKGLLETSEATARKEALLNRGLGTLDAGSIDFSKLDGNDDGTIDNIIFLFPTPEGEWNDLLWPHSSKFSEDLSFSGIKASTYTFQPYDVSISTLIHEMNHSLGLNDLYSYINQSQDITGNWSIMSSQGTTSLTSVEKEALGWLDVPSLSVSNIPQTITLDPLALSSSNGAVKIPISVRSSSGKQYPTQYIYLEYRTKKYEAKYGVQESGLLIWRHDPTLKNANGNAYGPPYYLYLYRPFGDEQNLTDTSYALFSDKLGRRAAAYGQTGEPTSTRLYVPLYTLTPYTDDTVFYEGDNTNLFKMEGIDDPYYFRFDQLADTGLCIYDITENPDDTISFQLMAEEAPIVSDPIFSDGPGSYDHDLSLEIISPEGGTVYYTTDGTTPTEQSARLDMGEHLAISGTCTINAVCEKNGAFSNVVTATYHCYTRDAGGLPSYDGTGGLRHFELKSDADVVYLRFDSLPSSASAFLLIYDKYTQEYQIGSTQQINGNYVRVPTTGVICIECSSDAQFRISEIYEVNEPVSWTSHLQFLDEDFSPLEGLVPGSDMYITTSLRNNSDVYHTANVLFAMYEPDGTLAEMKIVTNQPFYQSLYSFDTGVKIHFDKQRLFKIFVWEKGSMIPEMVDFYSIGLG